jgi:hypothetical protein
MRSTPCSAGEINFALKDPVTLADLKELHPPPPGSGSDFGKVIAGETAQRER